VTRHTISYIRECIRSLNYVVTLHAAEELDDDNLTILDLESIILTGEIAERQRDRRTRESKSVVRGATLAGEEAEVVVKVGASGKLIVLTVYLL
jgi:hypothetical protein